VDDAHGIDLAALINDANAEHTNIASQQALLVRIACICGKAPMEDTTGSRGRYLGSRRPRLLAHMQSTVEQPTLHGFWSTAEPPRSAIYTLPTPHWVKSRSCDRLSSRCNLLSCSHHHLRRRVSLVASHTTRPGLRGSTLRHGTSPTDKAASAHASAPPNLPPRTNHLPGLLRIPLRRRRPK
jgi:hypothetical protein